MRTFSLKFDRDHWCSCKDFEREEATKITQKSRHNVFDKKIVRRRLLQQSLYKDSESKRDEDSGCNKYMNIANLRHCVRWDFRNMSSLQTWTQFRFWRHRWNIERKHITKIRVHVFLSHMSLDKCRSSQGLWEWNRVSVERSHVVFLQTWLHHLRTWLQCVTGQLCAHNGIICGVCRRW